MKNLKEHNYKSLSFIADLITAAMIIATLIFAFQDFNYKLGLPQLLGLVGVFIYLLVSISPVIAGSIIVRRVYYASLKKIALALQAIAAVIMLIVIIRATPPEIIVNFEGSLFAQVPFYLIFAIAIVLFIADFTLRRKRHQELDAAKENELKENELKDNKLIDPKDKAI